MINSIPPFYYALISTLCFAYATTIFTEFSRKVSPFWMNSFKAFVALFAFWITVVATKSWITPDLKSVIALVSSGCIGLMIGDIFMLHAMKDLGASRVLMMFGLHPFILGVGAYFLFGQSFSLLNFLGVVLLLCCLFTISLENYKKSGSWQFKGLLYGLIAISMDASGVLLTRYGFDTTPGISSIQVNAIRCVGAILGFFLIYYSKEKITFKPVLKAMTRNEKIRLVIGSLMGTYLSLLLYLYAISKGQLSIISSVTVTGPMFASAIECIRYKKWPSFYLLIAFMFFIAGFCIFTFGI
jgi:drug/metabolite transporter (DMT)-like permease